MGADDVIKLTEHGNLMVWCLGCDHTHVISWLRDDHPNGWEWDEEMVYPTISPSLLIHRYEGHQPRCHSFIRNGQWQYLSDCEHDLRGQTISMLPVLSWPI